jgi:hypothetical protein
MRIYEIVYRYGEVRSSKWPRHVARKVRGTYLEIVELRASLVSSLMGFPNDALAEAIISESTKRLLKPKRFL